MTANKFVKFAALAASVLLALTAATPAAAKAWSPTSGQTLTDGKFMASSAEDSANPQTYSLIYDENANDSICQVIGEGSCAATHKLSGTYVLGVCTSATDTLCIANVSVFAQGKTAASSPATVIRQIKAPTVGVAAANAASIPNGGATTLYTGAVAHAGGASTYAVTASVNVDIAAGKVSASEYSVAVVPYTEKRGGFVGPSISAGQINDYPQADCVFLEDNFCGQIEDFAANTRVSVTVRMPATKYSFLGARLTAPELVAKKIASGVDLTVTGNPVSIQQLEVALDPSSVPTALGIRKPQAKQTKVFSGVTAITAARALVKNKATATRTFWQFNNWDSDLVANGLANAKCGSTAGIRGLFATDAIASDGFVPAKDGGAFKNTINGVLNDPSGAQHAGTIDVLVDPVFAKCALGKSSGVALSLPSSAKGVGYTLSAGKSGTWLKASAKGIKYSAPMTLAVK
ncbi:MAG: hypothetical protein RL645_685 [Actinomycetota bacterium]|jgi:hypothetical protein